MKTIITTLQDALAYQLRGLLSAETKVRDEFTSCIHQITSRDLHSVIDDYIGNADNKLLKLNRIFNYLMQEPGSRQNEVIAKMIDETHYLLNCTSSPNLKDVLMISCIQNINAYKTASYKTAYLLAAELELDTAADLVQQILEWELTTGKRLAALSIHEFNILNGSVKSR